MPKVPIPNKDELFNALVDELSLSEIHLTGNIEGFKATLHESFLEYLGRKVYKDKYLYEFIFLAIDSLLLEDIPSQVSDNAPKAEAAK
jgi:hypothetical protein